MTERTSRPILHFLSASRQLHELWGAVKPLKAEGHSLDPAAQRADQHKPPKATGVIVIIPERRWGANLNLFVALQEWHKRSKWELRVPKPLESLKQKFADFDPGKFKIEDRTSDALKILNELQATSVLFVPVRVEQIFTDQPRDLGKDEFDLDLPSLLWMMGLHHPNWQANRHEIEIACLGQHFNGGKVITVGFKDGERRINLREPIQLSRCLRVIGVLPEAQ